MILLGLLLLNKIIFSLSVTFTIKGGDAPKVGTALELEFDPTAAAADVDTYKWTYEGETEALTNGNGAKYTPVSPADVGKKITVTLTLKAGSTYEFGEGEDTKTTAAAVAETTGTKTQVTFTIKGGDAPKVGTALELEFDPTAAAADVDTYKWTYEGETEALTNGNGAKYTPVSPADVGKKITVTLTLKAGSTYEFGEGEDTKTTAAAVAETTGTKTQVTFTIKGGDAPKVGTALELEFDPTAAAADVDTYKWTYEGETEALTNGNGAKYTPVSPADVGKKITVTLTLKAGSTYEFGEGEDTKTTAAAVAETTGTKTQVTFTIKGGDAPKVGTALELEFDPTAAAADVDTYKWTYEGETEALTNGNGAKYTPVSPADVGKKITVTLTLKAGSTYEFGEGEDTKTTAAAVAETTGTKTQVTFTIKGGDAPKVGTALELEFDPTAAAADVDTYKWTYEGETEALTNGNGAKYTPVSPADVGKKITVTLTLKAGSTYEFGEGEDTKTTAAAVAETTGTKTQVTFTIKGGDAPKVGTALELEFDPTAAAADVDTYKWTYEGETEALTNGNGAKYTPVSPADVGKKITVTLTLKAGSTYEFGEGEDTKTTAAAVAETTGTKTQVTFTIKGGDAPKVGTALELEFDPTAAAADVDTYKWTYEGETEALTNGNGAKYTPVSPADVGKKITVTLTLKAGSTYEFGEGEDTKTTAAAVAETTGTKTQVTFTIKGGDAPKVGTALELEFDPTAAAADVDTYKWTYEGETEALTNGNGAKYTPVSPADVGKKITVTLTLKAGSTYEFGEGEDTKTTAAAVAETTGTKTQVTFTIKGGDAPKVGTALELEFDPTAAAADVDTYKWTYEGETEALTNGNGAKYTPVSPADVGKKITVTLTLKAGSTYEFGEGEDTKTTAAAVAETTGTKTQVTFTIKGGDAPKVGTALELEFDPTAAAADVDTYKWTYEGETEALTNGNGAKYTPVSPADVGKKITVTLTLKAGSTYEFGEGEDTKTTAAAVAETTGTKTQVTFTIKGGDAPKVGTALELEFDPTAAAADVDTYKWTYEGETEALTNGNGAKYTPVSPADVGKKITVTLTLKAGSTYEFGEGEDTKTTAAAVAETTGTKTQVTFTIKGGDAPKVGTALELEFDPTAAAADVDTYKWTYEGETEALTNGNGAKYTPVSPADVGKKITVTLTLKAGSTYEFGEGEDTKTTAAAVAETTGTKTQVTFTIKGGDAPKVGTALELEFDPTAAAADVDTYKWTYEGETEALTNGNGAKYTPVSPADVGKKITVTLTLKAGSTYEFGEGEDTKTTAAAVAETTGTKTQVTFTIKGGDAPKVGTALELEFDPTAAAADVDTYKWTYEGETEALTNGNGAKYTPVSPADVGKKITVTLTLKAGSTYEFGEGEDTKTTAAAVAETTGTKTQVTFTIKGGDAPKVGTALELEFDPTAAAADVDTYKWTYEGETEALTNGNGAKYTPVSPADVGKKITVTLTLKAGSTYEFGEGEDTKTTAAAVAETTGTKTQVTFTIKGGDAPKVGTALELEFNPAAAAADVDTYKWTYEGETEALTNGNGATYTPTNDDFTAKKKLSVTVTLKSGSTYEFDTGKETVTTDAVVAPNPKSFTVTLKGTPQIGQTLTATTEPSGITVTKYEWKTVGDGTDQYDPIEGSTSTETFKLTKDQYNKKVVVAVTGDGINYISGPVLSNPTEEVKKIPVTVAIEGTAKEKKELIATVTPIGLAGIKYEWKQTNNGETTTITNPSTDPSKLTLTNEYIGSTITVTVTTTDEDYESPVTSDPSPEVVGENDKVQYRVKISGTPKVGQTIEATTDPSVIEGTKTYEWSSKEKSSTGDYVKIDQTSNKFVLAKDLIDHLIKVAVTISGNNDYVDTPVSSTEDFGPVVALPKIASVTIEGTPKVGQTLTAKTFDSENKPLNIPVGQATYTWSELDDEDKSTAIKDETTSTLLLKPANANKRIKVSVKGDGKNYDDNVKESDKPTEKVEILEIVCNDQTTIVPGLANCCEDEQCSACSTTELTKCQTCKDGYEANDEGKCEKITDSSSSDSQSEDAVSSEPPSTECTLVGCSKCVDGDTSKCAQCYTDYGFVLQNAICVCNTASDFGFAQNPVDDSDAIGGKRCKCADDTQTIKNGKCVSTQPPQSTCTVNNCEQCKSNDNTYCEKCKEGFGLRGGYCTKCKGDLYNGPDKPCNYDCATIPNCAEFGSNDIESGMCTVENGEFYCIRCEGPYYLSQDHKACIPYDISSFSCSNIPGCLECNDEYECTKCNKDAHWVENNGYCTCDNNNNFYEYENQCLEKVDCDENSNCEFCLGPNKICQKCKANFGLKGGKCTECGDGLYQSQYSPCLITNCPDSNCGKCTNYDDSEDNHCRECKEGFDFIFDGRCINTTKVDCNGILGCTKCYAGDMSICAECNSTENFKFSRIKPGTCVCTAHYDFVDNKCVRPPAPYSPPKVNISDIFEIPDSEFNPVPTDGGNNYVLKEDAKIGDNNPVRKILPSDAVGITIPKGFASKNYYLDIKSVTKTFVVQLPTSTSANIECNGNKLKIPAANRNINIAGGGTLKFDPIGEEKDLTLKTVTFQPDSEEIKLESDSANITILTLDVFGDKTFTGQVNNGNSIFQTVCNLAKVEADSDFKARNLKFEKLKVGLRSLIDIDDTVNVAGTPIELFHIGKGYGNQRAPLVFTGINPPNTTGDITINDLAEGQPVPDAAENFTVASFLIDNNNNNKSYNACMDIKDNSFKGNDVFNKNNAVCDRDEKNEKQYNLVAMKPDDYQQKPPKDKDGLSAGAIAGIVIACVVVVAAIIALLVYFLVIKKKNASTTSTQGDSSIAI